MISPLKLKGTQPITNGNVRWIFQHPDNDDLIIKVIREDAIENRFGKKRKWYKLKRRYGIYLSYVREIQEYVTIHAKNQTSFPFLQRISGLVETDLGLGLVIEAVKDKSGTRLAPTLRTLIDTGKYDDSIYQALQTFFDSLLNCDIIINDFNPGNMVYTYSDELGYYFVLIDGLGNNSPIPLKTLFPSLNRKAKRKRFEQLRDKIEHFKKLSGHYKND